MCEQRRPVVYSSRWIKPYLPYHDGLPVLLDVQFQHMLGAYG